MYSYVCIGKYVLVRMYWYVCLVCLYWYVCSGMYALVCMYLYECIGMYILVRMGCNIILKKKMLLSTHLKRYPGRYDVTHVTNFYFFPRYDGQIHVL